MIGRLTGVLAACEPDGALILDVGGVGYELTVPAGTRGVAGDRLSLHVHTHVREDAIELFGFLTAAEREVFRILLGVSHVGPKLAMALLGALPVAELARAVESGDVAGLTRVPGVGKKTAQRVALELKGKLTHLGVAKAPDAAAAPAQGKPAQLHDALVRMGYRPAEAERAVAAVGEADRPLGELIRDALAVLSR